MHWYNGGNTHIIFVFKGYETTTDIEAKTNLAF